MEVFNAFEMTYADEDQKERSIQLRKEPMPLHMQEIDSYLDDVLAPVLHELVQRDTRRMATKPLITVRKPPESEVARLKNAVGGSSGLARFALGLSLPSRDKQPAQNHLPSSSRHI